MTDWNLRYFQLAAHVSSWSKDRSTQVGCVIFNPDTHAILSVGYNGMVRGMDDSNEAYHERPLKYSLFEHAERNGIYNSARHGVRLDQMGICTTLYPCADCARAIKQSGLTLLVTEEPDWNHDRWGESFNVAREILKSGEVEVAWVGGPKRPESGKLIQMPWPSKDARLPIDSGDLIS